MLVEAPGRVAESGAPPASAGVALWTLVALAVLSPWPFGSTPSWAVGAVCMISLAAALVASLDEAGRGALWLPRIPFWPLAALVALGLIQLVPLPAWLHVLLAPGSATLWHPTAPAAAALLGARARPISIYPAATSAWLGLTGGLIALALLAPPALGRRRTMIAAAWILVAAGTLVAVYGIVARTAFGTLLYGHFAVPTVAPFGPFVNKNHFAGYVEMPALLALGLGRGLWRQAAASHDGVRSPSARSLVALAAAVTMGLAVLLSLSRGGVVGFVCGLGVFVLSEKMTSGRPGSIGKIGMAAGLVAALAIVIALLPREVHERLLPTGWRADASATFRVQVWKNALQAWRASPIVGQGMGAFADALPRYKTTAGLFRVEHPENELIEMAVEGGLVGLVAAIAAVVGVLALSLRAIRGHRDRVMRGVVTGAGAAVTAVAVHGLVDFNLRIPSNAVMFVLLIAMVAGPAGTIVWRGWRPSAFVVVLLLVIAVYAMRRDAPAPLRDAHAFAVKAYADRARPAPLRLAMADRSVRHYVALRPADPEGWLLAAWIAAATGQPDDAASLARYAVTLDPERQGVVEEARPLTEAARSK